MVLNKTKKYGLGIVWKSLLGHWRKPSQGLGSAVVI
jgi:hypothetical protein